MRERIVVRLVASALVLAGCGTDENLIGRASTPHATPSASIPSEPPAPEPTPTQPPARPIPVPALPAQGFAVGGGHNLFLVDLEGNLVATLPGLAVTGHTRDRSGIWVRRGPDFFRVEPGASELEPVIRATWRHNSHVEVEPRGLPPPEGERRDKLATGQWRYALRSPVSDVVLAQWSDECEIPSAHFVYPGSEPVNVMGPGGWWQHPSSKALGWTPGGVALVYLPNGACGGSGDPPGIYAFTEPGASELIFEIRGYPRVLMWGDASRVP